jgi:xanthine dehydrogenase YagS FAD-binding subunit
VKPFKYRPAANPAEAVSASLSVRQSAFVAGGTTLIDLIKLDVLQPRQVVDINRIGCAEITSDQGGLRIGALVRNSDLARHALVRANYPVLAEALLSGASAQLRNLATTGGNLLQRTRCIYYRDAVSPCNKREPGSGCSAWDGFNRSHAILGGTPACIATSPSDMCVALAALDAAIVVLGPEGERTIPFADFHLLPGQTPAIEFALGRGEVITALTLPPLSNGTRSWYVKLRDRESYEFALASAAVVLRSEHGKMVDVRIGLGGVATKPWRATEAEELLRGQAPSEALLRRAADAALQGAQGRRHNQFKVELARRVIVRALEMVLQGQPRVRDV